MSIKKITKLLAVGLVSTSLTLGSISPAIAATNFAVTMGTNVSDADVEAARAQILADTNAAREAQGLPPLKINPALNQIAQNCSNTQAERFLMAHCYGYQNQYPAGWTWAAENVAGGYSVRSVVGGWMGSDGHRANILNGKATDIGIGFARDADGRTYFTQNFAGYGGAPVVVNPPVSIAKPSLQGTPQPGGRLSVNWADASKVESFSFQWIVDGIVVGHNEPTFALTEDHVGSTIAVKVTASKTGYSDGTATSDPITVLPVTIVAGQPTVTGTSTVGEKLTVNPGQWSQGVNLSYQWKADGANISGATSSTFTLTNTQVGKTISVVVTGSAEGISPISVTATHPTKVAAGIMPGSVAFTNSTVRVGQVQTVKLTSFPSGAAFKYQWKVDGKTVTTADRYTPVAGDKGKKLSVVVTATKSGYATRTITVTSGAIAEGVITTKTPTISGNAKTDQTVKAITSGWTSGVTLKYQWYLNGVAIKGATASSYKLPASAVGKTLSVKVSASKSGFKSVTIASANVKVAAATITTKAPTVSGTVKVGNTVKAVVSGWTSGTSFKYQWYVNGTVIKGATSASYKIPAGYASKNITVGVKGSKTGYTTTGIVKSKNYKVALGTLTAPAPKITGTAKVGKTLKVTTGTWTSGTTLKRQWYANGVAIRGATGASYKVTSGTVGKTITVKVTGSKSGYATVTKTSAGTKKVTR
jgi:uncharacterized protein YkwD